MQEHGPPDENDVQQTALGHQASSLPGDWGDVVEVSVRSRGVPPPDLRSRPIHDVHTWGYGDPNSRFAAAMATLIPVVFPIVVAGVVVAMVLWGVLSLTSGW